MTDISIKDIEIRAYYDRSDKNFMFQYLLDLDNLCYGGLDQEDTGTVSYWSQIEPYSFFQIAYYKTKVVGYIDIIRFSDDGVRKLSNGELREGNMLEYLDRQFSDNVNLYISSIAVLPEFRNLGIAKRLFESAIKDIKEGGFLIKGVYAIIWSDSGKSFCKKYKKTVLCSDKLGHDVIKLELE